MTWSRQSGDGTCSFSGGDAAAAALATPAAKAIQ
jgi:hypothetical protein